MALDPFALQHAMNPKPIQSRPTPVRGHRIGI
jgi:hypothetical protein